VCFGRCVLVSECWILLRFFSCCCPFSARGENENGLIRKSESRPGTRGGTCVVRRARPEFTFGGPLNLFVIVIRQSTGIRNSSSSGPQPDELRFSYQKAREAKKGSYGRRSRASSENRPARLRLIVEVKSSNPTLDI
jgi:hypothetical protein